MSRSSIFSFETLRIHPRIFLVPLLVVLSLTAIEVTARLTRWDDRLPNPNLYGQSDFNVKISLYEEFTHDHQNHVDTVIVGDSTSESALYPTTLSQALDAPVFNLSFGGMSILQYNNVEPLMFDPINKPDRLIIAPSHASFLPRGYHEQTRLAVENSYVMDLFRQPSFVAKTSYYLTTHLWLLRYSDVATQSLVEFTWPFVPLSDAPHSLKPDGYLVRSETPAYLAVPDEAPTENNALTIEIYSEEWQAIEKLIKHSRENDQQLLLVTCPYSPYGVYNWGPTNIRRFRALLRATSEVEGIDYINGQEWPGLDPHNDFQDDIHMTGEGGKRFTAWVVEQPAFARFRDNKSPAPLDDLNELIARGKAALNNDNHQAAAVYLERVFELSPEDNPQLANQWFNVLLQSEKIPLLEDAAAMCATRFPSNPYYWRLLVMSQLGQGYPKRAATTLESARSSISASEWQSIYNDFQIQKGRVSINKEEG